ncbi:MAG: SDR family oxidoreductase [Pseudomonadota bacterium]
MTDFADQLCVVTGAASGLGAAVASSMAAAGGQVLLLDINDAVGEALAAEIGGKYLHCDVSAPEDWQAVASYCQAQAAPKYLYLNAGIQIAPPTAPLDEYQFQNMQLPRYRKMMGVNVDGVVFGLQALLPLMQSGGAVVVTSSLAGVTPYEVDPLYAMSKHAVSGLVRSLAGHCQNLGLTINAICPGGVDTGIIPNDQRTERSQFMAPEDVALEVTKLMDCTENGKTWAKVAASKPAWIIRAPGDRG